MSPGYSLGNLDSNSSWSPPNPVLLWVHTTPLAEGHHGLCCPDSWQVQPPQPSQGTGLPAPLLSLISVCSLASFCWECPTLLAPGPLHLLPMLLALHPCFPHSA